MNNPKNSNVISRYRIIYLLIIFNVYALNLNAQVFTKVGCKAPYETRVMEVYNNRLIHCGFDSICGQHIEGIGSWDASQWYQIGGLNSSSGGASRVFAIYNNVLFTGGDFYTIGGKTTNKIARWNGLQWDSVAGGLDDQITTEQINAMAVYKNELYVAGRFRQVDGVTGYNHIAVWNGSNWRKIGGLYGSLPQVNCMAVYKGELYVGGLFSQAGFTAVSCIARWDGKEWRSVGKGANYIVESMVVDTVRDVLYVGGGFNYVQDTIPCQVAQWDGSKWSAVGEPSFFKSNVLAMEMYRGYLYAGGISDNGLVTDTCLARWDGVQWEPVLGPSSTITCLKTYKDELYLGGSFKMINNDSIPYLAKYYSPDSVIVGQNKERIAERLIELYPNPVTHTLHIKTKLKIKKYQVIDIQGKIVLDLLDTNTTSINISNLKKGSYILKAYTNEKEEVVSRFVKE